MTGDEWYDDNDDVEDNGDGEDWSGLAVDEDPLPDRAMDSWAITQDSLAAAQQQDLSAVMSLLDIKQHNARALFIYHRGKMERIYDCLDRKGRACMLREANIVLQEEKGTSADGSMIPSKTVECNVCFDVFSMTDVSTMDCGDSFCNDCWTEHFYTAIKSGTRQIRCMEVKCAAICEDDVVRRLLGKKYPEAVEIFDRFLLESYLEDNDSVKWCPSAPHCGRAIRVGNGERYCEVECPCGVSFCFNCAEQKHSPCPCTIWKLWNTKNYNDLENIKWIVNNTKSCPKCFRPIEKLGGCNLVKCVCGQHLCWSCGAPTGREHTWEHINGHSCNRFSESENSVESSWWQLERYMHYSNRFNIHGDSYKEEHDKLGPGIQEWVKQLESDHLEGPRMMRDWGCLTQAHQQLLQSRQVLSQSYAFAYYMFDGAVGTYPGEDGDLSVAQNLFEDQQEQLECHVEQLSQMLATVQDMEIVQAKQNTVNLARIVGTLCGEMYKCIQDELLPLLTEPMYIAKYMPAGPAKAKELVAGVIDGGAPS